MKPQLIIIILSAYLIVLCLTEDQVKNDVLIVKKTATNITHSNTSEVTIQYKVASNSGKVSNVVISDYLPEQLYLVSGNLVVKADDATAEWKEVSYIAKLSCDVKLTLHNISTEIILPPAVVSYTRGSVAGSLSTNSVNIYAKISPPEGKFDFPLPIAFFTLILPILAGVFLINSFHGRALTKVRKSSQAQKKET